MEATGVYWKPIWNLLEDRFELLLVNAQHIKNVPGRKTDIKDCEWIAQLLQHGLLRGSFVPPRPIRELRDLNRYRASLEGEHTRVANRIQKVLEDANIKLASVASDVLGQSGRHMLCAIITGECDADRLAEMAQGRLRNRIPELRLALHGRVFDHHRFWLRQLFDHLLFLEGKISEVAQEIERRSQPFEDAVSRWDTISGVDRITACALVAEIGSNMDQFPSAAHADSWAGFCPGNNESAGYSSFRVASSLGNAPRVLMILRRLMCNDSTALVVYMTRRTSAANSNNGMTRCQLPSAAQCHG